MEQAENKSFLEIEWIYQQQRQLCALTSGAIMFLSSYLSPNADAHSLVVYYIISCAMLLFDMPFELLACPLNSIIILAVVKMINSRTGYPHSRRCLLGAFLPTVLDNAVLKLSITYNSVFPRLK